MACEFDSILKINDGTIAWDVPGHASLAANISQGDTGTGNGEIEYSDGSARRWVRFERRAWLISGSGPAPAELWKLDLKAATWTATFFDPDQPGVLFNVDVVPIRPATYTKDMNTATRSWSLELREAQARP